MPGETPEEIQRKKVEKSKAVSCLMVLFWFAVTGALILWLTQNHSVRTAGLSPKNSGTKTQPDSAFRSSVTAIEEQGILESFCETSSNGARNRPAVIG
jgi:hypothetical protein